MDPNNQTSEPVEGQEGKEQEAKASEDAAQPDEGAEQGNREEGK